MTAVVETLGVIEISELVELKKGELQSAGVTP